ncbi:MAG: dockerin type I domain-containing protein [Halanaerobiales bacterium]
MFRSFLKAKSLQALFGSLLLLLLLILFSFITVAEEYEWRNVEIVGGGFVTGIIFSETEKDLIYARTDIGGAYRWDPENERWIPLLDWVSSDEWNLLGIESLAADPVDPDRVYVAAGTYTNEWTSMNGVILRSADRGESWERTEMPFKFGGNEPGRSMGERLAVDPNNNSVLYFGSRTDGLWRSEDYGATWSRVESFPVEGDYVDVDFGSQIGIVWIEFDRNSPLVNGRTGTIYVGVADTGTSIYHSTNGGETWEALPGQPVSYLPHHGKLASNGILYITYGNTPGPYNIEKGDVWKYDIQTGVWKNISPVPSSSEDNYFGYGGLAVDRNNPDILMVATMNSWWPDDNIYRSTDGGETWVSLWSWGVYPERIFRYEHDISAAPWLTFGKENIAPPEVSPKLGWMIGDLEIDPFNPDRMMYGTGATIYGSENLTKLDYGEKILITVMCKGLEETSVQDLISPPNDISLLSALGDLGGFRHDNLHEPPASIFTSPTFTTGTSLDYAELVPDFIVRSGYTDSYSNDRQIGFSYDGGQNWFQASSEPGNIPGGGKVAAAADASVVIWSGMENTEVYWTADNGSSWNICIGLPQGAEVISDRVNPAKFYAYKDGSFYISVDGGNSFTKTFSILPSYGQAKALPGIEGDIWYAGNDGGLWHSTDGSFSFIKLTQVETAEIIGFGKPAPGKDYMAIYMVGVMDGVHGVYRSDDAGESWLRINDDEHRYGWIGKAITGDPDVYGRVYLATNGRGIIYGDPVSSVPEVIPGDLNGDQLVDSLDYVLMRRYLLNTGLNIVQKAADLNGDKIINSLDYVLLRRTLLNAN